MDATTKEALLDRFRDYLERMDDPYRTENMADADADDERSDLYALFVELAALKNETKIASRQFKGALDQFRELFETVRSGQETLREVVRRQPAELEKARQEALRPLLLELLDLKDRLEAGLRVDVEPKASFFSRFCQRERDLLTALTSGQEISLRRLEQILAAQGVHALTAVGEPLDPLCMRAVEVSARPDVDRGVVTEELRKGYLWGERLLRPAEVIVNRPPESTGGMADADR